MEWCLRLSCARKVVYDKGEFFKVAHESAIGFGKSFWNKINGLL